MAMANSDPALSARLGAYHEAFWWMDPGAKWSLAKAGIDPTDPSAQAAAHAAAHIEMNGGLGFAPIGSPVTKPSSPPDVSSILAGLEQQPRYTPATPAGQYAAPSSGPLRQLFTDDAWNQLDPTAQQAINNLQVTKLAPGEQYANQGLSPSDLAKLTESDTKQTPFQLQGWTQLTPAVRDQIAPVLAKAIGADQRFGASPNYVGANAYFDIERGVLSSGGQTGFGAALERNSGQLGILEPLAPIMRPAFMVSSAPFQELTGQFRNVYELATQHDNPNWAQSQSDLGIAAGDLLGGRKVDVGSGIFVDPNSEVGKERQRRLLERGTIDGHGITPGRTLASAANWATGHHVFEPGSKPYALLSGLTDAAFAIKADPSIKAMKFGAEVRAGSKLIGAEGSVQAAVRAYHATGEVTPALKAFSDAGGLTGIRPTISKDAAEHWLTAPSQLPTLEALDNAPSAYAVYRALGRQGSPDLAVRIFDNQDGPAGVANILRDELGTTIRDKFNANDVLKAKTSTPSRWVSMMPDHSVDASNLQANVRALERVGSLVKAPDAQLGQWFDAMARTTLPEQRLSVWEQAMDDTAERLVGKGVPLERAKTLTRLWQESQSVDRVYAVRAVGEGAGGFDQQLVLDGLPAVTTDNKPAMLAQTLDGQIPLPDWRALRKSLSVARPFLENTSVQGAEHLLSRAQGTVWKALQISTVKTMIKVLGDEQLAISARGYNSLLNHPIDALSIILATPLSELPEDANFISRLQAVTAKKVRWAAEQIPGVEPRLTSTVTGHNFETLHEVQQVATHGFDAMTDDLGVLNARDWKVLHRLPGTNDTEFLKAHGRHFAQYAASPETSAFARADTLAQAQEWYWDGPLQQLRLRLAKIGKEGRPELLTREGSDAYVAKSLGQMNAVTNGNPELMDAIGSGELKGTRIWTGARDGTPTVNKSFLDKLKNYREDFPIATPQQKQIYSADLARRQVADGIFGRAIHTLLGTPSAILSKSPLFRQAYWERIVDNAPFMSAEAQNATLKAAGEANVGGKLIDELIGAVKTGNGDLSLQQADDIAKGHGLDMVRRTTHEFSQRSQAFDMLRLLTPFGEVWRKTIQRWANIVNENPQVVRRLQQGLDAARSPDLGAFMGNPAGQGFFHTDANGEEVFSIPGSEWATQALTGVPVPLVGNVKGLSLGTEFFPALGPVASIPVAYTMQKLHLQNTDLGPLGTLGEVLFPYGPPKEISDAWNYAPSWMKNAFGRNRATSPDSVRTFNNSIIDYIRYGVSTGEYDTGTPEGIQHAVEDATDKAHKLSWIRGATQFFVPGAPAPQMLVRDKSGKLLDAALLVQDYKKLQDADPNTAGQKFLDQYGPGIFQSMTSKSYAYVFGIPTSADSAKWVDDHASIKRDLPHIFGYFAPPSDPNQFDYEVYKSQLEPGGGRAALSPEQWSKLGNARLAALQYGHLRDKVDAANGGKPADAGQRAWLAMKKQELIDRYPGYADSLYGGSGLPSRPDAKLLALEAEKAANDPTVQSTDAGKGLSTYLNLQAKVDEQWVAQGFAAGSWQMANGEWAIQLRTWLRGKGVSIQGQHPQFGPLFEDVFDRAMKVDTDPNNLTPGG